MNKIIGNRKFYGVRGIIFSFALLCAWGQVLAAVSYQPMQYSKRLLAMSDQLEESPGVIIIDNFEYAGSPLQQGWHIHAHTYTRDSHLWGMTTSPELLAIVRDEKKWSRVLELLNDSHKPFPNFQKYIVSYLIETDIPREYSVLSLKMKAPLSENAMSYEVIAVLNGGSVEVHIIPGNREEGRATCPVVLPEDTAYINPCLIPFDRATDPVCVEVEIGREVMDGDWHLIIIDLAQVLTNVGGVFETLSGVVLRGNEFRCDEIAVLTKAMSERPKSPPYLFHIEHVNLQIFEPHGYLRFIFASDEVANAILPYKHTIKGPDGYYDEISYGNTAVYAEFNCISLSEANFGLWQSTAMPAIAGIDPAITAIEYAAAIAAYEATLTDNVTMKDVRRAAMQAGGGTITVGLGTGGADITVDARLVYPLDVPMLMDTEMAEGPVASDGGINLLKFEASLSVYHSVAQNAFQPTPTTEPIPYYPLYSKESTVRGILSSKPYLEVQEVQSVAMSLYYGGYDYWPTVAKLVMPPQQTNERIVGAIFCSNGSSEDFQSLIFEVVDDPVTNTPPIIEDVDDQTFFIGDSPQEFQLYATDPDSFTFTSEIQFKSDIEHLTWSAYFKAYPFAYMLDPSTEPLIDRESGLVRFDPRFEGTYKIMVTVRDPDGAEDSAEFTIYCLRKPEWFEHLLPDFGHGVNSI